MILMTWFCRSGKEGPLSFHLYGRLEDLYAKASILPFYNWPSGKAVVDLTMQFAYRVIDRTGKTSVGKDVRMVIVNSDVMDKLLLPYDIIAMSTGKNKWMYIVCTDSKWFATQPLTLLTQSPASVIMGVIYELVRNLDRGSF